MKSSIEKLAFGILILFSLVGMLVFGIVIHEYSHYLDYKGEVTTTEFCALSLPSDTTSLNLGSSLGFYNFQYNNTNKAQVEKIGKTTEIKAYFLDFILFLAFDICLAIVIINRIKINKQVKQTIQFTQTTKARSLI